MKEGRKEKDPDVKAGASPCTHGRISRLRCRREDALAAQYYASSVSTEKK